MKFPKLDLVCSNDDLRPVMSCVCVGKEFTYASDAHIAVKHRTTEIFKEDFFKTLPDQPILIPARAIALMRKAATKNISLSDDKKQFRLHQVDGSVISYNLGEGNYPDVEKILPDKKDCVALSEIGVNTRLIHRLSEGLGTDYNILHLWFFGASKTILCDTNTGGDYFSAIGVIMPVMIKDK